MTNPYKRLHDILSDCIESGRLTEDDLPDDYRAIVHELEKLSNIPGNEEKLWSYEEDPEVGELISEAFSRSEYHNADMDYDEFYEHGHWWVECKQTGAQWSVVDSEGGPTVYVDGPDGQQIGFDFEQVTEGEEL